MLSWRSRMGCNFAEKSSKMKAAVLFQKGEAPKYVTDFVEPVAENDHEIVLRMKASAVKNLDKMRASGQHYSTQHDVFEPKVVGGDGVGILPEGKRVYAIGISGMIAEKALVSKDILVDIPDNLDDAVAAALPNAVMGSALALRFRAGMQKGETVLINGATGVTGKMAVQLARYYDAKKIIVTGRNEQVLAQLKNLGADEIISLRQDDESISTAIKRQHNENPIDVVIDYLWGHSAELILNALKGQGGAAHRTRFITVGGMAGDTITLSSSILRSTDIQLSGSGLGSWSPEEVKALVSEILPEMFQLATQGKLVMDTVNVHLSEIETAWLRLVEGGKRLVVLMD